MSTGGAAAGSAAGLLLVDLFFIDFRRLADRAAHLRVVRRRSPVIIGIDGF